MDVVACRLLGTNTGQQSGIGAGVIAWSIGAWRRVLVIEPVDDLNVLLHLLQRLHCRAQLEICPLTGRPPTLLIDAIGDRYKGDAFWGNSGTSLGTRRNRRL